MRAPIQYCSTYKETNSSYIIILVEVIGKFYTHIYSANERNFTYEKCYNRDAIINENKIMENMRYGLAWSMKGHMNSASCGSWNSLYHYALISGGKL